MRTFISNAIAPLSIFWILIALALLFYLNHKINVSRILLAVALSWGLLVSTGFLPNLLIKSLESQYGQFKLRDFSDTLTVHILVLGAGHKSDPKLSANNQLTSNALGRLVEGIRVHGLIQNSKLVLSGGLGTETESHAEVLKQTAIILGVKSAAILTLNTTKNTADEAKQYKNTFGNQQQLILVTEAYHMPRSMILFRKLGLNPIPAPANYLYKRGEKIEYSKWLPSSNNIYKTEIAIHEYAGMAWVWISK